MDLVSPGVSAQGGGDGVRSGDGEAMGGDVAFGGGDVGRSGGDVVEGVWRRAHSDQPCPRRHHSGGVG